MTVPTYVIDATLTDDEVVAVIRIDRRQLETLWKLTRDIGGMFGSAGDEELRVGIDLITKKVNQ